MCHYTTCHVQAFSETNDHISLACSKHSCWKIFVQWFYHHLVHWQKEIQCSHTKNSHNDGMCAPEAIKKKGVTTKCLCTCVTVTHSLVVSVGNLFDIYRSHSQDQWAIVLCCCYNSGCLPYVISRASTSSLSRTLHQYTGLLDDQPVLAQYLVKRWPICWSFISVRSAVLCNNFVLKNPPISHVLPYYRVIYCWSQYLFQTVPNCLMLIKFHKVV